MADAFELGERVGAAALGKGLRIAVAESLTSGVIASRLGAAAKSSDWFAGGVVAYAAEAKFRVLKVDPGPVANARCAVQMAKGCVQLLDVDLAVAVTGVGGPEPDEGHPPGTVYVAVSSAVGEVVDQHRFDGEPSEVVARATTAALEMLLAVAEKL
ncbi:nicotinamide-nucleotide amidase [Kribbella amoyensis]|uniref:Nicotinamide-nucleotide amidase n=1 Tax=Kribbella amoyensis TaxID=996641 RepID=A0A561B2C2_9ACTN|nr:CinA family protein [Kribbella amoyensis]TWD72998.1 nicotinamide-nucleotide amidase [Kribbella amoyensis]